MMCGLRVHGWVQALKPNRRSLGARLLVSRQNGGQARISSRAMATHCPLQRADISPRRHPMAPSVAKPAAPCVSRLVGLTGWHAPRFAHGPEHLIPDRSCAPDGKLCSVPCTLPCFALHPDSLPASASFHPAARLLPCAPPAPP
jgi:hypothetical protein